MLKIGGKNRGASMGLWCYVVDIQYYTLPRQLSMEQDAVKYMCTKGIDRGISIYLSIYTFDEMHIVFVFTDILGPECLVLADCTSLCDRYCECCVVRSGAWGVILGCFC